MRAFDELVGAEAGAWALDEEGMARREALVGFAEGDVGWLKRLHEALKDLPESFAQSFYDHVLGFEEISLLIAEAPALERLRKTQDQYFDRLTAGGDGWNSIQQRLRAGVADGRFSRTSPRGLHAGARHLSGLIPQVVRRLGSEPEAWIATLQAFIKVALLDMGLAVDTSIEPDWRRLQALQTCAQRLLANLLFGSKVFFPGVTALPLRQELSRSVRRSEEGACSRPLEAIGTAEELATQAREVLESGIARHGVRLDLGARGKAPIPVAVALAGDRLAEKDASSPAHDDRGRDRQGELACHASRERQSSTEPKIGCTTRRDKPNGSTEGGRFPVAIVGLAFRLPGDLSDEESFWAALRSGKDLISRIDCERWAVDELCHPRRSEPGRSITFSAGILSRVDEFDAAFFGISPREAACLDPQQRLLLELAWEAMENGGIVPSSLAGSNTAVYVGISSLDYGTRGLDDLAGISPHSMTGNTLSIAANRLSYAFDLRGPSLAVDTACSSSLVALHHACECLRAGEASAALVGGVNLLLHPYPFVGFTKASMLAGGGRCKVFDASADGYVRAEGGAVLLLKPLAKAIADGDHIQAVILASGVNSDGRRKTGITIPSAEGQAELMRTVLEKSGLSPDEVDFIEAHGTGTAVGDPIEAAAIGQVYGQHRAPGRPLPIGSVKANLGHLEAASGMAGLIKAVLVLKNRALPPALHIETPNPRIDFRGLNLELARDYRALTRSDGRPLVGGVSSFGFGGTNAHVLLEEYPQEDGETTPSNDLVPPLFLSARTEAALRAMAKRYADLLGKEPPERFYDIAYGAAFRRERMEKRLALRSRTPNEAREWLSRYARGESVEGLFVEDALPEPGGIAFVYSGNGAQWPGMGRRLLSESARFCEILTELDTMLRPLTGFSVVAELESEASEARLASTAIAQPLLFAIQVALTGLLREQGVQAEAVVGHSVGEVAAAWASGALDLGQAVQVICARSSAQETTRGTGRMAAVGLSEAAMKETLTTLGSGLDVEIAGINSPCNVTIAGECADLERLRAHLEPEGVFYRLLDLDYAFHSRRMDALADGLTTSLAGLAPGPASRALFVSTVTGDVLDGSQLDATYWWRNVREPVRFAQAVTRLIERGCRVFLEVSPHAILRRYVDECLAAAGVRGRVLPTLSRSGDGSGDIEEAALRAHLLADRPGWAGYFPAPARRIRLPNYPWQRERHWHERTMESLGTIERRRVHPLLGWRLPEAEVAWENTIDPAILPWLSDHKVGGAIVFPGAAYAEMALAVAREWFGDERLGFEELDIIAPMVFDGERARTLRLTLNSRDGSFQIKSRRRLSEEEWTLHAAGRLIQVSGGPFVASLQPLSDSARPIEPDTHYRLAAQLGLDYGPTFRGLASARAYQDRIDGDLDFPENPISGSLYLLHPALLDVCYQSLVDFFRSDIEAGSGVAFLPVKIGRLEYFRPAPPNCFRARLKRRSARSVLADFELLDAAGQLVARLVDCRFRAAPLASKKQEKISRWRIVPWLRPHPADGMTTELPAARELLEAMRLALEEQKPARRAWFEEALPLMEALVVSFAFEAFRTSAQAQEDGLSRLATSADPYTRWLTGLLRQEGLLHEQEGQWSLAEEGSWPAAQAIWRTLLREHPACLPQLVLLGRVGRQLPRLLTQESERWNVLNALWRSPVAETLHEEDPAYSGTHRAVENVLHRIADGLPPHRRLRVLEIAARPSEWPRDIFAALPEDRFDYVLALPSEDLADRQRANDAPHPNLVIAVLDSADWQIRADRVVPQAFDVVIIRHALHRVANPRTALAQARRWLSAGGYLLLAERYPDWSADFLAGLDPAWWHAAAGADVPLSSLLPPAAWAEALKAEGFEDVTDFSEPAAGGLAEGAYLVLARRPLQDAAPMTAPEPAAWLLLVDAASSDLAGHLAARLTSQGQQVEVADRLPAQELANFRHVVHLRGWDAAPESSAALLAQMLADVQALAALVGKSPRLWVVTRGGALASDLPYACTPSPAQSALWGFGRVVMNEYPALSCTLIELAADPDAADTLVRLENEFLHPDGAHEIVLANPGRYTLVLREEGEHRTTPAQEGERFRLDFRLPGQLRNLLWLPQEGRAPGEGEVEIQVHATGLNFRDVMYLMGLLPDEAVEKGFAGASLGLEFSGVVSRVGPHVRELRVGDKVMGFGSDCFASHVVTRADALALMPEEWSFEAAATVPTVFFTVHYALKHLADLQPGERVLIHGAAGGVGIAAIQLAKHLGAEVFATAGSDEKRDFVRLLGADHVFDSRSLAFADGILAATNGEGVDVVLNSLAGESMRRSLAVLKPFGRFLELGKRDFFENTPVGLRPFKDNISYFGIDADQLLMGRPQLAQRLLREVMALFREGALVPLPCRVFPAERVVDAFRVMQQARHIGKVVVSLAGARPRLERPAAPRPPLHLEKESTWLVTGGLSGFGLESARWLASRGVGHLVLVGRRGMDTPGAREAVEALTAQGVKVRVFACDVTDAKSVEALIEAVRTQCSPLKGVLHAASTFDDALVHNLDAGRMEAVIAPKLRGAWNLHQATLHIPLDHFVLYSSVSTVIGNPGQANYVAANAGLEGLAALRRSLGLPAVCIAWGLIGDVGYLARNTAVRDSLVQRLGKAPLSASRALDQLERLLSEGVSAGVGDVDWNTVARLLPSASRERFALLNRPFQAGFTGDEADFRARIIGKTPEEVAAIVQESIIEELAQILAISAERIDPSRPLHDLGLDSLMAVELALGLEQRLGVRLPVMTLNESPTVEKVSRRIVEKLLSDGEQKDAAAGSFDALVRDMARQHGESGVSEEEVRQVAENARELARQGVRLSP